ncbi:MAG: hypothetical protein ACLSHC_16980 [Bilophila wadsworthia]
MPTKAGINKLTSCCSGFLKKRYDSDFPDIHAEQLRLLQNLNPPLPMEIQSGRSAAFCRTAGADFSAVRGKGVRFPGIAVMPTATMTPKILKAR